MSNPSNAGGSIPRGPNIRRVVLLDIVLPAATVFLLQRNGAPALAAYAVAGLFPIGSVVATWLRRRGADVVGIGVAIGIASGLFLGLVTDDPRFGLVRAAPGFALFGIAALAALASLATDRPLMFFVARAFAAGGDPAKLALWDRRLSLPRFRHAMRRLTFVWGASALIEACLGLACAFFLPAQIALVVEPLLAFAVIGALLAWTRRVQRRAPAIAFDLALSSLEKEQGHA